MDPTAKLFDDWARRGEAERMQEGHLPRAEQAIAALGVQPGDRCLDLGCGNGWATRLLHARAGATGGAHGVDAAPDMIARAREQSAGLEGLEFHVASFEALPLPDAHVQRGFSFEALSTPPTSARPCARCGACSRPGRPSWSAPTSTPRTTPATAGPSGWESP